MTKESSIEHPWQKTPTQLIQFAERLMDEESDFENQLAFLILDVGVETMFITYLSLPEDVTGAVIPHWEREKKMSQGSFYVLLKGVEEAAGQSLDDIDLNKVLYFHNIRNKLYHLGDGIVPTDENLNSYLTLAKDLLDRLLSVDLNPQPVNKSSDLEENFMLKFSEEWEKKQDIEDSVKNVKESLAELKIDLAIAVNKTRPEWTRRSVQNKLKHIWNEYPDEEDAPLDHRMENQKNRKRLFNELLNTKMEAIAFMDKIINDITYLFIGHVSSDMRGDMNDDLREYSNAQIFFRNRMYERENKLDHYERIMSDSEEIITWVESYQKEIEETFWDK